MIASTDRRRRSDAAFTLVELLVVIAIISLLMSLLLPSLRGAADASRSVTCRSNLRRIVAAALTYGRDRHGQMPDITHWGHPGAAVSYWNHSILQYLDLPFVRSNELWSTTYYDTVLTCPSTPHFPGPVPVMSSSLNAYNKTYAINSHMAGSNILRQRTPEHGWFWPRISPSFRAPNFIHRVPDPSGAGWFFDSIRDRSGLPPPGFPRAYHQNASARERHFQRSNRTQHYFVHRFRGNRNRDHEWVHDEDLLNVGFADGRAESVPRLVTEDHQVNWTSKAFWGQ